MTLAAESIDGREEVSITYIYRRVILLWIVSYCSVLKFVFSMLTLRHDKFDAAFDQVNSLFLGSMQRLATHYQILRGHSRQLFVNLSHLR